MICLKRSSPTLHKRKPNMKTQRIKLIFATLAMLALVIGGATRAKAQEPLPSWNDGPAKQAILGDIPAKVRKTPRNCHQ